MARDDEKKSSGTAKTALGLSIGALGLGLLGAFSGGYDGRGGGGFLGLNLFGNRNHHNDFDHFDHRLEDHEIRRDLRRDLERRHWERECGHGYPGIVEVRGSGAGLGMYNRSIGLPAVNTVVNAAASSGLEVYELNKLERGNKAEIELDMLNRYLLPMQNEICNLKTNDAVFAATAPFRDALLHNSFNANIDRATCHTIQGRTMMMPNQMADPYHGAYNELVSRRTPYVEECGTPSHDRVREISRAHRDHRHGRGLFESFAPRCHDEVFY